MATINSRELKSRDIRVRILRMLCQLYDVAPGLGERLDAICHDVEAASGPMGYEHDEVRAELGSLLAAHMIEVDNGRARVAPRGRDFAMAEFPWDKLDEFTGGMGRGQ